MPLELPSVLFAAFWKSGIALGTGLAINLMLKNRSADLRRLVLSATVTGVLVAVAATPILPRWTAETPLWLRLHRTASPGIARPSLNSPMAGDSREFDATVRQPIPVQTSCRRLDFADWMIPLVWFAGAAMLLMRFAANLLGLRRLRKSSHAVTDSRLRASGARFGRRVRIWESNAVGAPVTWGIVRAIILVPTGFEELPEESRDAVMEHELAHIQAHDFLMRGLAETVRALIWFQPLMWMVWRRLREEQELACDNRVLAAGGRPSAYAKLLLDWHARRRMDSLIAVGIAHQSCLKRRLYALLDPDLRRDTVASVGVAGAWFLALAGALPLAAISFTEAVPVPQAQGSAAHPNVRAHFDVVSVKPCKPGVAGAGMGFDDGSAPGRLRIDCDLLADTDHTGLIQAAYNRYASGHLTSMRVIPIEGGPDWIHSEKFQIDARSDGHPGILTMEGPMMQTLLEDRFQLKLHRETRQGPVYELTVGKGSLKLKPFQDGNCIPVVMGSPFPVAPEGQRLCRSVVSRQGSVDIEGGTLPMLADLLGRVLDRPVIDKTGITGNFEIHLKFSPDESAASRPVTSDPGAPAAVTAPGDLRLFQALQEELGLKLVAAKGPVDVLVIDHVERPSEN